MAKKRLLTLFKAQNGLCWICDLPMAPPVKRTPEEARGGKTPHAFEATLDHLTQRGADPERKQRPAKAAHAKCNHARHHYPLDHPKVVAHINGMKTKFAKNPIKSLLLR